MDFSLWPAASRTWSEVLEGAEYAERTGWHGIWIADHFMQNGDDLSVPVNEAFALLAGIVARTERVRVGSMVLGNTYRHPAVVANSGGDDRPDGQRPVRPRDRGRLAGERARGLRHRAAALRERLARFEEACQVIKGLLTRSGRPSTGPTTS